MPNGDTTELQRTATEGAIAADQQQVEPQPVLVGPTTANEFNTIGERLIPKGCFRFEDVRFEFDSSFVRPEVKGDMPALADLIDRHTITLPGPPEEKIPPPLSIFGHADPVGNDDYNKQLSGRRALAIYGMLVRDEKIWEDLFTQPFGGDKWGNKQIQTMLEAVGHSPGPIDGVMGPKTTDAVKAFQEEKGLATDGVVGPQTRKALYHAYMDFLCGPRIELDKEKNFLARHKDGDGLKGDVQGCGEFNPVLVFSRQRHADFEASQDKKKRNEENTPNRRVLVLLFAPSRRVNPGFWPCPRVKEGIAACKKRFFPGGDDRRTPKAQERKFDDTKDTFACRFYQVLSNNSPCERFLTLPLEVTVFIGLSNEHVTPQEVVVLDEAGVQVKSLTLKEALAGTGVRTYVLEAGNLPNPMELRWRMPGVDFHVAGPCDPVDLRNALVARELEKGQTLIGSDRGKTPESGTLVRGNDLGDESDQPFGTEGESFNTSARLTTGLS